MVYWEELLAVAFPGLLFVQQLEMPDGVGLASKSPCRKQFWGYADCIFSTEHLLLDF